MKPIIGIIMRNDISNSGKKIGIAYDDLIFSVMKSGGIPIMIPNKNTMMYLDICHGFIFQGGDMVDHDNLIFLGELMKRNIPVLGICLGMQEMGVLNEGRLYDVVDHKSDGRHEVIIKKDSLLYKILGVGRTIVNSRHNSALVKTNLAIVALAKDNVIEAIEDDNLKFFLGVQWHPESMYNEDINSKRIFDYFIKICNDTYISR